MAELIHDAWTGWTGYMDKGKLPALFLVVLLYLWFGRRQKEQRTLLVYTSVTAAACILPVTAAALMKYQTRFYDYEWIWSLVPLTAVTAYGMACFWTEYRDQNAGQWRKNVPVALFMLAAMVFCGSMGETAWNGEEKTAERTKAYNILEQLSRKYSERELCLWAPREIMEYAREKDAAIRLPYGRNIWDEHLNAYSYDIYMEETVMLEQWMEYVSETGMADLESEAAETFQESGQFEKREDAGAEASGTGRTGQEAGGADALLEDSVSGAVQKRITLEECVENALNQGVNGILLPGEIKPETLKRMETVLGTVAEPLEDYYLFDCR